MYTRPQKESSSTSSTSIHKKSNNSESSQSFAVQRQQDINSSQEKERLSYSRNAADLLAANVMRSMAARQQGEGAAGAASVTQAAVASVFQPLGEMSSGAGVQAKLTVGAVGDKYEQEADRVAAQVMRMSIPPDNSPQVQRFGEEDNPVQRWSLAQSITPVVHRQVDEQVQMRELVQRAFQVGGNAASGDLESRLNASQGGGNALAPEVRAFMEPRFGADFARVRVHTGSDAVQMNRELSAQAFTHGRDVYFGAGKSPGNNELTAHELTHVVQQTGSVQPKSTNQATTSVVHHSQPAQQNVLSSEHAISSVDSAGTIQLRRATWLERRAWLSFFDHYLPRKFLNHYMDDTGTALNLTQQEMIDCNPIVDLRRSPAFRKELAALQQAGGGSRRISRSGWGGALTNGTLGNFTIYYDGQLTVKATGNWNFQGTMHFYDYWDFDPKGSGSGRPLPAELKVRIAAVALPGQPFAINSVSVPVSQTATDTRATWAGGTPSHVGDNAVRTGADMAAGDVAGVGVGPTGAAAGVEVGAQSSEDLN
jgi:hypothetical protein